jgi:hypothetical protein
MGSLRLVNKNGIDYQEFRGIYFYNEYKYKMNFSFLGKKFLYTGDTVDSWKNRVKKLSKTSLDYLRRSLGVQETQKIIDMVLVNENIVKQYIQFYKKHKDKMIFRSEGNSVSIFGNDLQLFDELKSVPGINSVIIEVILEPVSGVKYFTNKPKYKFRFYFKNKFISFDEQDELKTFLDLQKGIKLSGSLKCWFNPMYSAYYSTKKAYLRSAYYIDYDDEMLTTILALKFSDILGKHFTLEQRKTNLD